MGKQKSLFNFLPIFFLIGNLIFLFIALYYRPLNIDGGYYLSMAKSLIETPETISSLNLGYTPLSFMIFGFFMELFHIKNFTFFIFLMIIIQVFNAAILTKISSKIMDLDKNLLHLLFQFYLFFQLALEGINIVLEPFVVFYLLLAILATIQLNGVKALIISGAFCGLSFMSKQYGLASIAIVLSFVFLIQKVRFSILPVVWVCLGFVLSSILTMAIYRHQLGIDFNTKLEFFSSLQSYGHRSVSKSLYEFSKFLFLITPYFLLMVFWKGNSEFRKDKIVHFCFIGILAFLPAFYFKQYLHYYHLILPFIILVSFYFYTQSTANKKLNLLIIFSLAISLFWSTRSFYYSFSTTKTNQTLVAQEISKSIPPGSVVYISDDSFQPMRYLCDLNPPLKNTFGYGFTDNYNDSINLAMIKNSDFLILKNDSIHTNFRKIEALKNIGFIYKKEDLE